jgi:hypothetical protein
MSSLTYPLRQVRGDWMTEDGIVNNLIHQGRWIMVRVSPDGHAYDPEYGEPVTAEVWKDCVRLGRNFSPDAGELKRCGITPVKRGSATDADVSAA